MVTINIVQYHFFPLLMISLCNSYFLLKCFMLPFAHLSILLLQCLLLLAVSFRILRSLRKCSLLVLVQSNTSDLQELCFFLLLLQHLLFLLLLQELCFVLLLLQELNFCFLLLKMFLHFPHLLLDSLFLVTEFIVIFNSIGLADTTFRSFRFSFNTLCFIICINCLRHHPLE